MSGATGSPTDENVNILFETKRRCQCITIMGKSPNRSNINAYVPYIAAVTILSISYFLTAPRNITWWEGSSWPLSAITLGVSNPPGSLILTLLGWFVIMLPLGEQTFLGLSLFGSLISLAMSGILCLIVLYIRQELSEIKLEKGRVNLHEAFVIFISLVTIGLSLTLWQYSIKFTPYILTGLFTVSLVYAMLRWWQVAESKQAIRWLFIVALLFGLDFSVHRTNLLLVPGVIIWVLIKYPLAFRKGRNWLAVGGGIILGLSLHFLLIPLAGREPAINMGDPSTISRFYDYVSLKQYGGGWLANLIPRKGAFVTHQLADYFNAFRASFANTSGKLGFLGILPLLFGLFGIAVIWHRRQRLAIGLLTLFLLTSLGAVIYLNLPANFPWPMDRHYIPSFLIFGLFMTVGALTSVRLIGGSLLLFKRGGLTAVAVAMLVMPLAQFSSNLSKVDSSGDRFAYDYARNILTTIEPNAILFVQGDIIWPLWYLRFAEETRPDVSIISPSLMNTPWYVKQVANQSPPLPMSLTHDQYETVGPKFWPKDTVVSIAVNVDSRKEEQSDQVPSTDSVQFYIPANLMGQALLAQDWLLLDIIIKNNWHRPIYFTNAPKWLKKHCRYEGLVSKLMPVDSAVIDCPLLWRNMMESYSYTGYRDEVRQNDRITKAIRQKYVTGFTTLVECEDTIGNSTNAELASDRLKQELNDLTAHSQNH